LRQSRPTGSYYYPGAQLDGSLVPIIHRILPFANLDGIRNKLFFFTGFEYYNQSFEANQEAISGWVPTMSERQGISAPHRSAPSFAARAGQANRQRIR